MSTVFNVEQVDCGADLTWVSQFPSEKEMLILPLSNFEVVDMRREKDANVYELNLNLNYNSASFVSSQILLECFG
jgi:hypothetical protein